MLPPITSADPALRLIRRSRSSTPCECPCAVSTTMTSTPASTSAARRSSVPSPTPTAAPTRSLPCWSFAAFERVLVVRDGFELRGLITVKDILKSSEHPDASKDQQGKLRVGGAVGIGEGTEGRVAALVEAGGDRLVRGTAHADYEA